MYISVEYPNDCSVTQERLRFDTFGAISATKIVTLNKCYVCRLSVHEFLCHGTLVIKPVYIRALKGRPYVQEVK